jgi:hypothetical protein
MSQVGSVRICGCWLYPWLGIIEIPSMTLISELWMNDSSGAGVDVRAGEAVYREGDAGQSMYVIESGAIDLVIAAAGAESLATLGPGDSFGVAEMLENQPRAASAIARENSRLLRVERSAFVDLIRQSADVAIRLLRGLALRNQYYESALGQARLAAPAAAVSRAPVREVTSIAIPEAPAKLTVPGVQPAVTASTPTASKNFVLRRADGQEMALDPAMNEYLVGRPDPASGINPDINLSGADPTRSLSRRHAKLIRRGDLYFVREETATVNGTFVNGARVPTGVDIPAMPGDTLRFGAVEVQFVAA